MEYEISTFTMGLHSVRDKANLGEFDGKDYACMHSIFIQIDQNHLLTDNQKYNILYNLLAMIDQNVEAKNEPNKI